MLAFHVSAFPTGLEVVSAPPWLKVSSSGTLQLFILSGSSPDFYFQFGSWRCGKSPSTPLPSGPLAPRSSIS